MVECSRFRFVDVLAPELTPIMAVPRRGIIRAFVVLGHEWKGKRESMHGRDVCCCDDSTPLAESRYGNVTLWLIRCDNWELGVCIHCGIPQFLLFMDPKFHNAICAHPSASRSLREGR